MTTDQTPPKPRPEWVRVRPVYWPPDPMLAFDFASGRLESHIWIVKQDFDGTVARCDQCNEAWNAPEGDAAALARLEASLLRHGWRREGEVEYAVH